MVQFKDAAQRNLQRVSASLLPAVEADSGGEADALALLLNAQQRRVSHHAVAIELREMLPDAAVTGVSAGRTLLLSSFEVHMISGSPIRSAIGRCICTSAVTCTSEACGTHGTAPWQQLVFFGTTSATSAHRLEKRVLVS